MSEEETNWEEIRQMWESTILKKLNAVEEDKSLINSGIKSCG